jgi:hypothetical protein
MEDAAKPAQIVQSHLDEIDAAMAGEQWLTALCRNRGATFADMHQCERNGGIRSAWKNRRLIGYYILLRDALNHTVLVCHDLSEDLEPGFTLGDTAAGSECLSERRQRAAKSAIAKMKAMSFEELLAFADENEPAELPEGEPR